MKVKVIEEFYTEELVKAHSDWLFVFGDNDTRKGNGGQACIRHLPNTIGISTKCLPAVRKEAYYTDDRLDYNKAIILGDVYNIMQTMLFGSCCDYSCVVFPKAGIGTGLAKLKEKAPKTFEFLCNILRITFGFDNKIGQIVNID